MSSDLLNISVSGLKVSQNALRTVGHNIANASTEGYTRQRVDTVANPATLGSSGYMGNGAHVAATTRVANQFVIEQVRADATLAGDLDAYGVKVGQLNSLLADGSTGLTQGISEFFNSLQNAADNPSDMSGRQLALARADGLAQRFNGTYDGLEDLSEGVGAGLAVAVSQVNALAQNIAQLNVSIASAQTPRGGPNDLLDQRDQALKELAKLVPVQVFEQGNGQININIGSGQSLVLGADARSLELGRANGSGAHAVNFVTGSQRLDISQSLTSGEVGGLLRFAEGPLADAYNQVGQLALRLSAELNAQHERGLDLNGQLGGNLFFEVNDWALAEDRVIGHSTNSAGARSLTLAVDDSSQTQATRYKVEFSANSQYRVLRESDGAAVASGRLPGERPAEISFDGLSLAVHSGAFASGDTFTLEPFKHASRDIFAALKNPAGLALSSPIATAAGAANRGAGVISAGAVTGLNDPSGAALPLLASPSALTPPMVVVFTSATSYSVLDNSDPSNPVPLDPPISNRRFTPNAANEIFPERAGASSLTTSGGLFMNQDTGFFAERWQINRTRADGTPEIQQLVTPAGGSARAIAERLNAVAGVSASAYTEVSLSGLDGGGAAYQVEIAGRPLLSLGTDPFTGLPALPADFPDPVADPDAAFSYLATRVNEDPALRARGISAEVRGNAAGEPMLVVTDPRGESISVKFTAEPGATLALDGGAGAEWIGGLGGGQSELRTAPGQLNISLAGGVALTTTPADSLILGGQQFESAFRGLSAVLSGTPAAGDRFEIDFNGGGSGDNRNGLALAGLQLGQGARQGFAEAYAGVVEKVAIDANLSEINRAAASEVLTQSESLQSSISGVNLDEEAADLIRFEQLFSANAQVISVARDIFDRLISSF